MFRSGASFICRSAHAEFNKNNHIRSDRITNDVYDVIYMPHFHPFQAFDQRSVLEFPGTLQIRLFFLVMKHIICWNSKTASAALMSDQT